MIVKNNLGYSEKKRPSQTQTQTKNPYLEEYQAQAQAAQQALKTKQTTPSTTSTSSTTSAYIPVDNSGNDYASLAGMSDVHKAAIAAAKSAWNDAYSRGDQAGMDAAHQKAEAIRALYDYSGGGDGSEYIAFAKKTPAQTPQVQTPTFSYKEAPTFSQTTAQTPQVQTPTFSYKEAPTYVNKYQGLIDELSGRILDQDPFSYDAESDPLYQQYQTSYTRGGERAMQDTLGQMAARTGGLASSYAGSAAQQSYNGYMSALADKIPELQQLAYEMYQDEANKQRLNLEMISALEREDYGKYQDLLGQYNTDRSFAYGQFRDQTGDQRYADETAYNRYLDQLSQYNTDRSFAYGQFRDQVSDGRYADETAYNRGVYADQTAYDRYRDLLSDARYADETAYNRGRYADETAYNRGVYADETSYNRGVYDDETTYNRNLKRAQLLAGVGDFSGYKALGFSDEEIQRLQAAYLLEHPELASLYQTAASGYGSGTAAYPADYFSGNPVSQYRSDWVPEESGSSSGSSGSGSKNSSSTSSTSSTSGSKSSSSGTAVKTSSLAAELGLGPMSDDTFDDLVADGKIYVTTGSDGKPRVMWINGWNSRNYMLKTPN